MRTITVTGGNLFQVAAQQLVRKLVCELETLNQAVPQ